MLAARRRAYELDIFWPPPCDHAVLAADILSADPAKLQPLEPAGAKAEVDPSSPRPPPIPFTPLIS